MLGIEDKTKNPCYYMVLLLICLMLLKCFVSTYVVHHDHSIDEPHGSREHAHVIISGFSFYQKIAQGMPSLKETDHDGDHSQDSDEDHQHPFIHLLCPHCVVSIKLGYELPIHRHWERDELDYQNPISDGFTSSLLRPPIDSLHV